MYNQEDQYQPAESTFTALTNISPIPGNQNIPEFSAVRKALVHLEAVRQHPVLLYMAEDQGTCQKLIRDEDIIIFYDALRSLGPLEHLDLVVNIVGGNITTVRKLLHMLHTMVSHLTILVPYKACSAGMLLCLGAHDIALTPIAELSPIDPHLEGMLGGNPSMYSSEDIAKFRTMARDWFGVSSENQDHVISILHMFCEKMFPPSLTRFFRAEQLVRQVALEALQFHLPDTSADIHQQIIEQLITGYPDHQYPLNGTDLRHLGLHITPLSVEEEQALWSLWQQSRAYLDASEKTIDAGLLPGTGRINDLLSGIDRVNGLLLGTRFAARHQVYVPATFPGKLQSEQQAGSVIPSFQTPRWEYLEP